MASKKTTVNLTEANWQKIRQLHEETGISQSDLINQFVSEVPVVNMGNQKSIAESFFEIRNLLAREKHETARKEVSLACQSINALIQTIKEMMPSKEA